MVELPVEGVARRVTRDLESQKLLEDLWIGRSTASKLISRQLRHPCDIGVQIELNAVEEGDDDKPWEEQPMCSAEQTRFRGTAARINFLAADRPDLQYASKKTSRRMANPLNGDWSLLKRVARYLVLHRRLVHVYGW